MLFKFRSPLSSVAGEVAKSSVTATLVRSTLPVLVTVIVYSITSPAVSTMASSALVRVFSIVSNGF